MSPRPQASAHVHISEPHVRVTEWRFAPGAETGWHVHEADYVVAPLLDGRASTRIAAPVTPRMAWR